MPLRVMDHRLAEGKPKVIESATKVLCEGVSLMLFDGMRGGNQSRWDGKLFCGSRYTSDRRPASIGCGLHKKPRFPVMPVS